MLFLFISCLNIKKARNDLGYEMYYIKKDSILLVKNIKFNYISTGRIIYDKENDSCFYKDDIKNKFLSYDFTYNQYKTDSLVIIFNTNFKIQKENSYYSNSLIDTKSIYINDSLDIFKIHKDDFEINFRIKQDPKYFYVCTFCNKSLNNIYFNVSPIDRFEKLDTLKVNLFFSDFIIKSKLNYSELKFEIIKINTKSMLINYHKGALKKRKIPLKIVDKF
jgi:hypothetical protein